MYIGETFYKRIKSCLINSLKVAQIDPKRPGRRHARGKARGAGGGESGLEEAPRIPSNVFSFFLICHN